MKDVNCLKCNKKIEHGQEKYGLHALCFTHWFKANEEDEFQNVIRQQSASDDDFVLKNSAPWNSSFFHGKFLKYAADLAGRSYIIKLEEDLAPELPFVEYLSNQIAQSLGIDIPPFYCIYFYERPAFVSQNLLERNSRIKILTHIYHYVRSEDEYCCETLIKIILEKTNQAKNVSAFIDICLFDALIGNHDRHGRNLGLLTDAHGIVLCPAYDNTSFLGLEQGEMLKANFSPRGKIRTKNNPEPSAQDYVHEFIRLNYKNNVIDFIERINITKIDKLISQCHCSTLMEKALSKLINARYIEMKNALQD